MFTIVLHQVAKFQHEITLPEIYCYENKKCPFGKMDVHFTCIYVCSDGEHHNL
jgi:hypothetical protein